jgi:hypothetical protein
VRGADVWTMAHGRRCIDDGVERELSTRTSPSYQLARSRWPIEQQLASYLVGDGHARTRAQGPGGRVPAWGGGVAVDASGFTSARHPR